jgi:hypothetical protein
MIIAFHICYVYEYTMFIKCLYTNKYYKLYNII